MSPHENPLAAKARSNNEGPRGERPWVEIDYNDVRLPCESKRSPLPDQPPPHQVPVLHPNNALELPAQNCGVGVRVTDHKRQFVGRSFKLMQERFDKATTIFWKHGQHRYRFHPKRFPAR